MTSFGSDPSPKTLGDGRYELFELLGQGAQAKVYRAVDTLLDVPRAIKVLSTDKSPSHNESMRSRLYIEARAMARVIHPNIIRLYDIVQEEDIDYVVMELHEGGTLEDLVSANSLLAPQAACEFVLQILAGLAAAHEQGIVHRDVKPSNVLISPSGVAKLADFGIAMVTHDQSLRSTRTGVAMGTLAFMAPEQRIDARSVTHTADIHAVGAMLYNLVTGEHAIDLFAVDVETERYEPVPLALRPVIQKATRYRAESRYQTVQEMAVDLAAAIEQLPEVVPLDSPPDSSVASAVDATVSPHVTSAAPVTLVPITPSAEQTLVAMTYLLGDNAPPPPPILAKDKPKRRGWIIPFGALAIVGLLFVFLGTMATGTPESDPQISIVADPPIVEPGRTIAVPSEPEPRPLPVVKPPEPVVSEKPGPKPEPKATPAPSPAPKPAQPAATTPSGPFPAGVWEGSFNGRFSKLSLSGGNDALHGEVVVDGVVSEVTGTFDPTTGDLVLNDVENHQDSGDYIGMIKPGTQKYTGRFEARQGRKVTFSYTYSD